MSINTNSKIPLYLQLKDYILEKIQNGEWQPGQLLPTEADFESLLQISRITVRHAIEMLEYEGYVIKKQGKGTFIAPPKFSYQLPKLTSFSQDIIQKNHTPGSKTIKVEIITEPKIAEKMGLYKDSLLLYMHRLRKVDNIIMGMHIMYYNLNLFDSNTILQGIATGNLVDQLDNHSVSFYSLLENEYHISISHGEELLKAISCPPNIASQLDIEPNDPLLYLERTIYTSNNEPLEFAKMYNRADIYNYTIHLSR